MVLPKNSANPNQNPHITCHKTSQKQEKERGKGAKNKSTRKDEHNSPGFGLGDLLGVEDLSGCGPLVGGDGDALGGVSIADDEDVVATTERVTEHSLWVQDHLAVFPGRLASAGSIVIPLGQLGGVGDWAWQRPGLASQVGAAPSDPDVLGDDGLGALLQVQSQQLIQRRHGDGQQQPTTTTPKQTKSAACPRSAFRFGSTQPAVSEEAKLGETERDLTSQRERGRLSE